MSWCLICSQWLWWTMVGYLLVVVMLWTFVSGVRRVTMVYTTCLQILYDIHNVNYVGGCLQGKGVSDLSEFTSFYVKSGFWLKFGVFWIHTRVWRQKSQGFTHPANHDIITEMSRYRRANYSSNDSLTARIVSSLRSRSIGFGYQS